MPDRKTESNSASSSEAATGFEADLSALENCVRTLEQGDIPLEAALKQFETGTILLRRCEAALKRAEQRIEILLTNSVQAVPHPFEPED